MGGNRDTTIQVLFDTRCVLCSRWVKFLLKHEADDLIRFVGAWTPTGTALAAHHGLSVEDLQRTYLVIVDDLALTRSEPA